jgi:hypothetical protein
LRFDGRPPSRPRGRGENRLGTRVPGPALGLASSKLASAAALQSRHAPFEAV